MLSSESACNMYISRSLAQGPTPCVTLYVSQNGTVPQFVVNHLLDVHARLAQIKTLSAKSGISWDIEDSEMVQKAMDDIEVSSYLQSFEKLRHRLYQNMTLTIVQIMSKGQQKIRKLHPKSAPYNQNGGERQCWVDAGSVGLPPR